MAFVPHVERHALHGITVVLETTGAETYVGRLDTADERGVYLKEVAIHDATRSPVAKIEFLRETKKYGVRREVADLLIERSRVVAITPLGELQL